MTTQQIRKAASLPQSYKTIAKIYYQGKFQQWITVSQLVSTTEGQNPAYFLRKDRGAIEEISHKEYVFHVHASVGTFVPTA